MTWRLRSLTWLVLAALGCGGADSNELALAKLDTCNSDWTTLYERNGEHDYGPSVLRWHDGVLYYPESLRERDGVVIRPSFMSLSDSGGEPQLVVEDEGRELWLEGDQLLFAKGDRLYAVDRTGGPVSKVVDGETFGSGQLEEHTVTIAAHALDDSYLYWVVWDSVGLEIVDSVWRAARAGGRAEFLGQMSSLVEELLVLPDALLAVGSDGHAFTLPKEGGKVRELPRVAGATSIGAAESGVLWSVLQVDGKRVQRVVRFSPVSGKKAELFWASESREREPAKAWSDDPDEWIVSVLEPFADGADHLSLWAVGENGRARRLACDPTPSGFGVFVWTGTLSPDAIYLVVQRPSGWALVRVLR